MNNGNEDFGGQSVHNAITGQQNHLYTKWRRENPLKQIGIEEIANLKLKQW